MRFDLSSPPIALILIVSAMSLMPLNDALINVMGGELSLSQLIFLRSGLVLAALLLWPATWRSFQGLGARTWGLLLMRGALMALAMVIYFTSLTFMELWQASALFFIAPLMISALAVPLLGERLGVWRILAQVLGFGGILLIAVPQDAGGFNWAFMLPLLAALYYALYSLMTRLMGQTAGTLAMMNVQHVAFILIALILFTAISLTPFDQFSEVQLGAELSFVLRGWSWPTLQHWFWLLGCAAMIGFLAFASANAYGKLEASLVAPFEYIYVPFAILWGVAISGDDWPTLRGWIGIGLILTAGLLVVFRENSRKAETAEAVPSAR